MSRHIHSKILSAYLDGQLTEDKNRLVASHVSRCPKCKTVLDDFRQLSKKIRELQPLEPPQEQPIPLVDRPAVRPPSPWKKWMLAGVAVATVLFSAIHGAMLLAKPTVVNASSGETVGVVNHTLEIEFSKPMDEDSLKKALSISPPTPYQLEWQGKKKLLIRFPEGLVPNQSYTLSISKEAEDRYGLSLEQDIVLFFDSWSGERNRQAVGKPAKAVGQIDISWTEEKIMAIDSQVARGSMVSRLVADQAAMDDLFATNKLSPAEYESPFVEKTDGRQAVVRFEKKDGSGFARATVEKLGRKDPYGAWFTTRLEIWEYTD